MRNKLTNVRANSIRPLLAAALGLALAFTFSCSGGESGTDSPSSGSVGDKYGYCVFVQSKICLDGHFDHCDEGGSLSNTCPFNSSNSEQAGSSSSNGGSSSSSGGSSSNGSSNAGSSSSTTPSSSSSFSSSVAGSSSSNSSSSSNGSSPSSSSIKSGSSSSVQSSSSVLSSSSIVGTTGDTFTDSRDGKIYKWVKIGTQTWMAQNLDYNASGSKCYSNNDANCATYGRLYDWATAMALPSSCNSSSCASQISAKHKGACPSGWHLSSLEEWRTLENYVGGGMTAGTKLKAKSGWNNVMGVSGNGTDAYGFSALPGGRGYSNDHFGDAGSYGIWWDATESGGNNAFVMYMYCGYEETTGDFSNKSYLFSVRCLQD